MGSSRFPLAYITLKFPKRSENFIKREILTIKKYMGKVLIFSLTEGEDQLPYDPAIRLVCLEKIFIWKKIIHHSFIFIRQPSGYLTIFYKQIILPSLRDFKKKVELEKREKKRKKRSQQFSNAVSIAYEVSKKDVAHIHAHYAHLPSQVALIVSDFTGIPFSFTAHAKDLYLAKHSRLTRLVKRATFVTTCTSDGESYLKNVCKAKYHKRLNCVHHGIDPEKFLSIRRDNSGKYPLILSAGRFTEKKGFDTLLHALSILKERNIPFNCIIAGGGKLKTNILALIKELHLDEHVELPGFLNEKALINLYHKADVFVLASRQLSDGNRDGIPNVILEAMASGLPIVATDVGGIPEVIENNKNGLLSPPNNPESFVDSLETLLTDQSLREKMGKNGRAFVADKFNLEKNTQKLFGLFIKYSKTLNLTADKIAVHESSLLTKQEEA